MGNLLNYFIYANYWIALSVSSLSVYFQKFYLEEINWGYTVSLFGATCFAYNFQRLQKINQLQHQDSQRQNWIVSNRSFILINTIISGILTAVTGLLFIDINTILMSIPFGFIVLTYAWSYKSFKGLRSIPLTKSILISASWTWCIIVMPFVESSEPINHFAAFNLFLWIIALCIPFDIRDVQYDKGNITTLPIVLGNKTAIIIASGILLLTLTLSIYINDIILAVATGSSIPLVGAAINKRQDYYYSMILDGVFLLPILITLVINA